MRITCPIAAALAVAALAVAALAAPLAATALGATPVAGATASNAGGVAEVAGADDPGSTSPGGTTCRPAAFRLEPLAQAKKQARAMLHRMTLPQEVTLMHGVGEHKAPSGSIGATAPIPSLGIPALNQQDGPAGIGDGLSGVTQLPAPEALAATFDPTAAACYGQVIGRQARGKGFNLVYGPTVNIVRVPRWGRTFESLGEDPVLTGAIGAAEVDGVQRTGTMAQVKHYAVYTQETNRMSADDDSVVDPKALHEIYLRPWDQVVTAGPSSVMCSYTATGGTYACQDKDLLDGYLDTTLRFPGFVGSDYLATHSTVAAVDAGLDQEQPTGQYLGGTLLAAVRDGQVGRATVDRAVLRILTQMYRFRMFTDDPRGSASADVATAADARVADQVAEEGTVLLKNAGHLLPLASGSGGGTGGTGGTGGGSGRSGGSGRGDVPGSIAVVGPAAQADPVTAGGGSATVKATHVTTPLAGIRHAAGSHPVTYAAGLPGTADFTPIPSADLGAPYPTPGNTLVQAATLTVPATGTYELAYAEPADYVPVTLSLDGQPIAVNPGTPPRATYTATVTLVAGQSYTLTGPVQELRWVTPDQIAAGVDRAVAVARQASVAVVVVGDGQESEAGDRVDLTLPSAQNRLVDAVAAANPHTVVVVDAGGAVAMPWLARVPAVLDAWYPGQSDGTALAAVLFGAVDPSGHLPVTFPAAGTDPVPAPTQFPGVDGQVQFSEGVDVGYRWYDQTGTTPLFPFGYGLSYTTFDYRSPTVRVAAGHGHPVVTATVRVTNTGHRAGADVVQLYLGQPASAGDPPRQLEAFRRVALAPGRSRTVTFTLRGHQLASYDTTTGSWRVAGGGYRVWMGDSSTLGRLPASAAFRLSPAGTSDAAAGPPAP
ncbi:MAG TPA: glycoside hydrolase family 3 C-terminal domain-containing protein [Acidimicrobiales bacterium]|nr:glycoside hydrolase family 3 C-terminal domain-containing protein [Acidimicrobiales bacterium]